MCYSYTNKPNKAGSLLNNVSVMEINHIVSLGLVIDYPVTLPPLESLAISVTATPSNF